MAYSTTQDLGVSPAASSSSITDSIAVILFIIVLAGVLLVGRISSVHKPWIRIVNTGHATAFNLLRLPEAGSSVEWLRELRRVHATALLRPVAGEADAVGSTTCPAALAAPEMVPAAADSDAEHKLRIRVQCCAPVLVQVYTSVQPRVVAALVGAGIHQANIRLPGAASAGLSSRAETSSTQASPRRVEVGGPDIDAPALLPGMGPALASSVLPAVRLDPSVGYVQEWDIEVPWARQAGDGVVHALVAVCSADGVSTSPASPEASAQLCVAPVAGPSAALGQCSVVSLSGSGKPAALCMIVDPVASEDEETATGPPRLQAAQFLVQATGGYLLEDAYGAAWQGAPLVPGTGQPTGKQSRASQTQPQPSPPGAAQAPASAAGTQARSPAQSVASNSEEHLCSVCLSEPINTVLFPCRHACVCSSCHGQLANCPLCRTEIAGVLTQRTSQA